MEGSPDSEETALSVKQAYLRLATLALADPYRLRHGEAEALYRRIGRWVHFVQTRPPQANEDLSGRFVLDLASDHAAHYLPLAAPHPALRQPRILDIRELTGAIRHQITLFDRTIKRCNSTLTQSEQKQRDLDMRFIGALGERQGRRALRQPTAAKLLVVVGLHACHYVANKRRRFEPTQADQRRKDQPLDRDAMTASKGATDLNDSGHRARRIQAVLTDAAQRRYQPEFRLSTWQQSNESEGGMAAFSPEAVPVRTQVGDLLAYTSEDGRNSADWKLGAVRWLRTRPKGGLELGVEQLADNAYAVGIEAISGPGRANDYQRGLLIPRTNPVTDSHTLLTASGLYAAGTIVRLARDDGATLHARLTELVHSTQQFAQFRFRLVAALETTHTEIPLYQAG
ncbi:hypothetical protein [Alkalilimnicola ehrlichii]|uniref:Uncharacterized protein n=1 Tax=Alkalilimnicola ehrlichii TaxID=351052 RepID=A0A3E0WIR1_9GAMM|nr:hypothetical protein [Alkalilimnicola ehrlichii]RFA31997.1 hypothetical protein CAL65_20785 [Alkalilimnicola ehrlichii]